ncbi:non-structural maintenance of chromosomes element 3 homolog [Armigeres subalbatus]|uniref:non-structural maintenance of chromosomes element 3 homolog n=1 Tax=Armigeres subalbatus TaxID=124917 RepID=UPI002ED1FFDF
MPRSSGILSSQQSRNNRSEPSQSQSARPSTSGQQERGRTSSQQQQDGTDDVEQDQMVINLVKAILNMSCNKHQMKKPDLVKNALGGNSRIFPKIIGQVMRELTEVYGYKLVETERNKTYILVSTITCGSILDMNDEYRKSYTLLYLILGYIFMKNGDVPEQGLWDFLDKLHISSEDHHSFFGDVPKLIKETFIKQAYLVRTKQVVEGMNEDRYFYGWGKRAEYELSKRDILESFCKLMGKPSVCFITQHTAAYGMNGEDDMSDTMEVTQN